jgi:hypothetical protein
MIDPLASSFSLTKKDKEFVGLLGKVVTIKRVLLNFNKRNAH